MWKIALLLLFCDLNFSLAQNKNPYRDPKVCGRPVCLSGEGKFKYGPNTKQQYKYSVDVRSLFNGTSKNESTLSIESIVDLHFLTQCEGVMKLRDSKLTEGGLEHAYSGNFSNIVSRFPLRFSFQDGFITELCPNSEEEIWVLNLKRGILSLFHNSMKRFDLNTDVIEDDVKGKCPTKYEVLGTENTSLLVEKYKDLSACTSRSKLFSSIQSVPYNFRSKIRPEASILQSESRCVLSIDNKIYNSIKCSENYLLKPFSIRGSGVTSVIKQNLVLLKEENSTEFASPEEITKRVSLNFDYTPTAGLRDRNLYDATKIIKKMCEMDAKDDHIEFSDVFTSLIDSLRLLTPDALKEIYEKSATLCPHGRRNILDALPYVGNSGAFSLMKDMILNGKIRPSVIDDWMSLISLTRNPDEEMMEIGAELLEKSSYDSSVILSLAAMTHTFCSQNVLCENVHHVQKITEYVENSIRETLSNDTNIREYHDKVVVYLKAIGNIGQISTSMEKILYQIIEDVKLDMEIRIAAIESFRKTPCGHIREYFSEIYRDAFQDAELRIASYLQIMRCPNYLLIRDIRHTLKNEEVNQVGSFVWSHLKNLLKSAVPSRVEIQGLLSDKDLVKKFSEDIRKYSHNYEGSIFFEEYNVGGNYDANLIFSPKSYLPASVSFNMTVDLFGESVNLFEVTSRMQGFENYLESLFGPKGPWSASKLQDKIPQMRFVREIGNELLKSQLNAIPNVLENKFGEPKISMSVKIFGNDLRYVSYTGYEEIKEAIDHLNPVHYFQRILSKKEINYHEAMMFLDSAYTIPTGAGLPLSFSALGTSSLSMKFFGNLNTDNFAKSKEFEVRADIKPTVSLDLTGSLCIDAFYAKSGLKLKSTVYSSSAFEVYTSVKGLKQVKVKIGIPQDKSEIINSRSELLILKHGKEEHQRGLKEYITTRSICTWPVIDQTIGIRACTEYHFVNATKMNHAPYFLLAGSAGFRIFLEKLDRNARDFVFEYNWLDVGETSVISATFDAPGSSMGRVIGANFTIDKHTHNMTLLIKTTVGKVSARGKYKNTPDEKYLQLVVDVNDIKNFEASMVLTRDPINHGFLYHPKLYLGINGDRVIEIEGSIKQMSKKGMSQYDVDLKLQTRRVTSKIFGYISKTPASLATRLRMTYKFPHASEQGIDLSFSLANRSKRNFLDIQGAASVESTSYPQYDFDSKLKLLRGHAHTETNFNITFNHKDDPERWTELGLKITDKSLDDSSRSFHTVLKFVKRVKNIDVNADFNYQSKGPSTNVALIVDYAKNKQFSSTLAVYNNRKPMQEFKLQVNVTVPNFHSVVANFNLYEKQLSHYSVDFNGTWFSGHSLSVRGFYQDKSNKKSVDHHAKLLVQSPSFQNVFCNLQYYLDDNELRTYLKFDQNNAQYLFLIKHINLSPHRHESNTLAKIMYRNKVYSLLTTIYSGDQERITMELHIDQMRDIHFNGWVHNSEAYKAGGLDLKWDANRDPNQKIVLSGNLTKIASFNYAANLLASYPGRTLLGNYEFVLRRGHLYNRIRFSWDDKQSFAVIVNTDYNFDDKLYMIATSEIVTPFENWRQTFLDAGFEHEDNMYTLNGTLLWEKGQHVSIDLFGNYSSKGDILECKYRTVLSSTVQNIPTLSASMTHIQNSSRIDTDLRLQYAPREIIDVKSKWEVQSDEKYKNYTGTIVTSTPFNGFNKGYLISKLMMTKDKYFRGVADLDFDFKKFSVSAQGRLKKLTNSMFTVNITTPIEKYSTINGKFGFIEDEKYLVALVTYPSKMLGLEILLSVESLSEFDTRFILGTPLDILKRVILIGKLKPETADFRAAWNSLLGGFTGKWHYVNTLNFEYSYIIYTPIENFEENSVILKILTDQELDLDVSVKLSSQKLGVKVLGEQKPALFKDLDIKTHEIYSDKSKNSREIATSDDLNWSGLVEIDTLVYPTMKGTLEIEQRGPVYTIKSKLTVPDGVAVINDRLEYYGPLSVRNLLEIKTPYSSCSEIESNYEFDISPGHNYIFSLNLKYLNESEEVNNELVAKYIIVTAVNSQKTHNLTLHAETPIASFLNIDGGAYLSMFRNTTLGKYAANVYLVASKINVASSGDLKIENHDVLANTYLRAKTASMYIPPVYMKYNRKTSQQGNTLEVNLDVPEMFKRDVFIHGDWLLESFKNYKIFVNVETPFEGFQKSVAGIEVKSTADEITENIFFDINPLVAEINGTFKNDILHTVAHFNLSGKSIPVLLHCKTVPSTPLSRKLDGVLAVKNKQFNITGNIDIINQLPLGLYVELIPQVGSNTAIIQYKITNDGDVYKFVGSAKDATNFVNLNADATIQSINEWNAKAKMDTSHKQYDHFILNGICRKQNDVKSLNVELQTPFQNLEAAEFVVSHQKNSDGNHLTANFNTPKKEGSMDIEWLWLYLENMKVKLNGQFQDEYEKKAMSAKGFYMNPKREFNFLSFGGNANFNGNWEAGSNVSLVLPSIQNITIDANVQVPPPNREVHMVKGRLFYTTPIDRLEYLAKYNTLVSNKHYGSSGSAEITELNGNQQINGALNVQWALNKSLENLIEYSELQNGYDVTYKLSTPKYRNKKALVIEGTYRNSDPFHNLTCKVFNPENRTVANGNINFSELANMNGLVNITIPYETMNYAGVNFSTETSARVYNRYLEAFWPDNSAKIEAKCDIETGSSLLHRTRRGTIVVEVPISSRHCANIDYIYKEVPLHSFGNATVNYNGNKIVDGKYDSLTESRGGLEKSTTHIELLNKFMPVGADYIHGYEYGAPLSDGTPSPSKDSKHVNLYHLTNRSKFAIEGDVVFGMTSLGQQIELQVKHMNKTVNIKSDYEILDREYKQHSRLEFGPAVWLEYNVTLLNETINQDTDAHRLQLDIQYPLRNFTCVGSYKIAEESISTDLALEWDVDNKVVQVGFDWKKMSEVRDQILLSLKHPSFEKDVKLLSEYEHNGTKIVDTKVTFDYAEDPDQMFLMGGRLNDHSNNDAYNYTYYIFAVHNATNLDLEGWGHFFWSSDVYSTGHQKNYKRSYLPSQYSETLIRLDSLQNEIELKRDSMGQLSHLKASCKSNHNTYTGNMFSIHEYNEAAGDYYLNLIEKVFRLDYNMSTDGKQSMHWYGDIPDARSAKFQAWRDYDDIRLTDITYYLTMNHSRLIVSNLFWRPDLFRGLQAGFYDDIRSTYNYIVQAVNDTRHYVRAEIKESIIGIWGEAEPYLQSYMDDMRKLRVIEDDIEEFKVFLNKSYHANDFYIKTICTITMYAFDELALKQHFESVPAIISEIWNIMGDSGKKIRKSIEWVFEKIKTYHKNITHFMRQLLDGDPIQHLSNAFSDALRQYDDFVRKMHVAFIKYIEKLWQQTYDLIVDNWYKMLIAIEPTFLKLVAYLETIAWDTSQEFLDFLYIRKNEIMESPYFARFSNLTHDVDKFYRDITGNNTLSSFVKYTKLGWNFLKERYMNKLPFAKELETIANEIIEDLNELRKSPAIEYLEARLSGIFSRLVWFYEYFEVESRIQNLLAMLYRKMTDYSQTALQAENRYREAKTNFIFDPNEGKMQWEQKLPMSWHAFNETPNFHEIPEIKMLYDIQNFFVSSHTNFWNIYHDLKPYTNPSEWLPPFKAQAFIIGNGYYITFDRKLFEFKGDCSYLLASDMKDHNFTLVMSQVPNSDTHKLLLVVNKTVIEINIFTNVIKVGDSTFSQLPMEIGDTFIYRDSNIVTISSASGFSLDCNTEFHVCSFEVTGWYFGKTAGLFGTINNEPSDDFLASTKERYNETNISKFAETWALNQECAKSTRNNTKKKNYNNHVSQFCEDLFSSKVSQFASCFERIGKEPFLNMCLESPTIYDACVSAAAYTTLCSHENTPLRLPDSCITCGLPNGSLIHEGDFVRFTGQNMTKSSDIVFLVEAKECNTNLTTSKNMKFLIDALNVELTANNIVDNRYAVVVFGGDGAYNEPRIRSLNGEIFTNFSSVINTLDNIVVGNGSEDIFNALIYATRLSFRPAVSKSFILLPCSECNEGSMKYDYPILHQLLSENAISLHILMNEEFTLQKSRESKIPYGIDHQRAYTKKDFRMLKGDASLRGHLKLPKTTMGLCVPLALETNGTLFTSKYLKSGKDDNAKKFISVFTKRVAEGSHPADCTDCECTASNSGLSYMECYSCHYPSRASLDYGFDEDELLMNLQPSESVF